jgi:hypothetical protein
MNKYHSVLTQVDGYLFDSKAEARRYADLKLLERSGEIMCLDVHPVYILQDSFVYKGKIIQPIRYEADFGYIENGKKVIEDVKGVRTAVFLIKQKMFWKRYPEIELRIIE